MTQDEIKHGLLDVCKVKGWDSDINILGFHVLCDKLKQFGAEAEREACAKVCDDKFAEYPETDPDYAFALAASDLAKAIRARGNT